MIDVLMWPLNQLDFARSLAYDIEMSIKEPIPELYTLIDAFQHFIATGCVHKSYSALSKYGDHLDMLQDLAFCYHHSVVHKTWGIEELIGFTDKYWDIAKTNTTSVAIKQFTAHRCASDKRFQTMAQYYRDSITRAKALDMTKWVVSGYFYWTRYSDIGEKNKYCSKCLNIQYYSCSVPYDCFTDKVLRCWLWLKCFGTTEKSKEIIFRYDGMLKDHEKLGYLTRLTDEDIKMWRNRFQTELDKFTGMIYHP